MTRDSHKNSRKLDANWSQAKKAKKRTFSGGWDQTPGKILPKCRTRTLLGPGRFPQAVRHLGCWLEVGGGASTTIRQRIIAMRTSFYRYVGLWKSGRVSTRIKKMIFQAVINGAAISGCEPYVFSTAQWKQLESERMSLLRGAFAGEAYNCTDKLRTLSDTTLGGGQLSQFCRVDQRQSGQHLDQSPEHFSFAASLCRLSHCP